LARISEFGDRFADGVAVEAVGETLVSNTVDPNLTYL
jgi:hypothetical protein